MKKRLNLYVSASPEMDAECELLGQLLANMTKSTQWTIKRTPGQGEFMNPDLEALWGSQFYIILLGMDVMAPMGVEWTVAQEAGLSTFAFHNTAAVPSPAVTYFMRHAHEVLWEEYRSPQEFIHRLERMLIRRLLGGPSGGRLFRPIGLDVADVEELTARLQALEGQEEASGAAEERRGAGRGGIILPSAP